MKRQLILVMLMLGMAPAFAQAEEQPSIEARILALKSEVVDIRKDVGELKTGYTAVIVWQDGVKTELQGIRTVVQTALTEQKDHLALMEEGNQRLKVVEGQNVQLRQEAQTARGQASEAKNQAAYARQQASQAQAYANQAHEATKFRPLKTLARVLGGGR